MKLLQYLKCSAVAFLSAVAVVATDTQAFAQLPGESNRYNPEIVDYNNNQNGTSFGDPLQLQYTYSEARNDNHLLSVWRGLTNSQVWMSLDNGVAFTVGGTETFVSPTVVAWGFSNFLVFHTGVDGNIWYTSVSPNNDVGDTATTSGSWSAVPGNFTNMSVSVAQMGQYSTNVYMVYRGLGNDQRVWGTWYNASNNTWSPAENISGGMGNSSPGVSMNNLTNRLTVTVGGTDNQLWMTSQALGAHGWNNWTPMGVDTFDTPHSAACANGNMVVSIRDINSHPEYATFDAWGDELTGFSVDSTGWQTHWAVQLAANGNSVYSLFNGFDNVGRWKQIYDCQ